MRFVLASANRHKADEISGRLPAQVELALQSDLGVSSPPEPASTFVENALIKARYACEATGLPAIADDSGLCVAALDGAPGIVSARYAGEGATDAENIDRLLQELAGEQHRAAFFYCALVCLRTPGDPAPIITEGQWWGEIAEQASGAHGFGYDPVFFLPELGKTAAELTTDEKHAISHRGQALKQLARQLGYL